MAQIWLVTGGSRGLGRAIVEAGLAAGNKVFVTARDIKSLADLPERHGDHVKLFAMDVTDEAAAANVEPGDFRTDFAGSSTELSEGHPEYDSTVGATARFQRNYNGKQPGDPRKAAQAIVQLTQERNPSVATLARQRCVRRRGEE
jgi:nucleoside-diphosphate-sugar epimerase